MTDISETDRELIDELRSACKYLLTPKYDTDYNILRFIQGWGYNKGAALWQLQRHLKTRKAFQLDRLDQLEDTPIFKEHFPSGLLGTTGKDNKLVMIEMSGRTDVHGVMKSVQAIEFFRLRMKFFERVYEAMNEQERLTGKQSGVIYIFDLDGISMDPFLITILTGPYIILWKLIFINYPEWINTIYVINVPTFFSILWKAFGPLLPELTRNKIKLLTGDWKKEILNYIQPECLPVHWGGTMVDENGDPMCKSKIVVPQGKVPTNLYWQNVEKYQTLPDDRVKSTTVKAGAFNLWSYFIPEPGTVFHYYINSPDDFTFAIYYCEDVKETDVKNMEQILPQIEIPGGLAPDKFHFVCEHEGAYHVRLGNEKAWLLSITFKYQWRFVKSDGSSANVTPLNGTAE